MELTKYQRIEDFLQESEEFLLKSESLHNLILGLSFSIRDNLFTPINPHFYSFKDHNKVVACALISSEDKPLMLTKIPRESVGSLIEELTKQHINLVGVVGDETTCVDFKDHWVKINKLRFQMNTHLGIYECRKIIYPKNMAGTLIKASHEHKDLLRIFIKGFLKDFCPNDPELELKSLDALIDHHLKLACLFLLKNERSEIVSMAAIIRSTSNTQTIGFVYTPLQLRGLGYGSSIVALLSDKILRENKKIVNLFTDLTNPTSNSIYQKLGYVKIGQNIQFDFFHSDSSRRSI